MTARRVRVTSRSGESAQVTIARLATSARYAASSVETRLARRKLAAASSAAATAMLTSKTPITRGD